MDLANTVAHNLKYQHSWNDVEVVKVGDWHLCKGTPPKLLHPEDAEKTVEYVLPSRTEGKWTVSQWSQVFSAINEVNGTPCKRVIMAMATSDGTVVYYFVNNGIVRPRKN